MPKNIGLSNRNNWRSWNRIKDLARRDPTGCLLRTDIRFIYIVGEPEPNSRIYLVRRWAWEEGNYDVPPAADCEITTACGRLACIEPAHLRR